MRLGYRHTLGFVAVLLVFLVLLWLRERDHEHANDLASQAVEEMDRFAEQMAAVKSGQAFQEVARRLAEQADQAEASYEAYRASCASGGRGRFERLRRGPSQQAREAVEAARQRYDTQRDRYDRYLRWVKTGGKPPEGEGAATVQDDGPDS
jgi:hypothetical protein